MGSCSCFISLCLEAKCMSGQSPRLRFCCVESDSPVLLYLLAPWSRILLEKQIGSQLVKKFSAFYGTPKIHYRIHKCPYPEPHRCSSCPHIPLPEDPSQYYPPNYTWVSQVVTFPQVSPPKPCIHLCCPPYSPVWLTEYPNASTPAHFY